MKHVPARADGKKQCSGCREYKRLDEFPARKNSPDGRRGACNACTNRQARVADENRARTGRTAPGPRQDRPDRATKWPSVEAFDAEPPTLESDGLQGPSTETPGHGEARSQVVPRVQILEEEITRVEEHRLRRRVKDLEAENRELVEQLSDRGEFGELIAEVRARAGEALPRISPRERTSGLAEATPLILASDWHIEEPVYPEQVAGRNRYDLDIATRRMERFFEATRWATDHQRQVFKIRDMVLWLGGDIITNFLHPDNVESNLLHPTEAVLMAEAEIARGIEFLLQDGELEQLVVPCNDGNHGRLTPKMRSATRTQNSIEVLLYAQLARRFEKEPRVKFVLPTSSFTYLDVYDRTIRFLHGDVFKYHGGVGGISVPLMRALARWETVRHADLSVMGHWHQRICLPDVMVNGSLIGFNSYAADIGARFEPPVQSMRILEPRRWCSYDIPLWVSELSDDETQQP